MPDARISHAALTTRTVSLNALRAFESAARHLSFTRAASELSVTQAAISHQVKALEDRLGVALFRRAPRGLVLTDEGAAMVPMLSDTFGRLSQWLGQIEAGGVQEVVTIGVVGTFAVRLLARLPEFRARCPLVDVRVMTHNNVVDLAGERLDYAIRYGDGAWHGAHAERVLDAPLSPLCSPRTAERLAAPHDLSACTLLRSYRAQDWPAWLAAAGVDGVAARGPQFDSSWIMVQAAIADAGVALAPPAMFDTELAAGRLVRPFAIEIDAGAYWLTRLTTRAPTPGMRAFRDWLLDAG